MKISRIWCVPAIGALAAIATVTMIMGWPAGANTAEEEEPIVRTVTGLRGLTYEKETGKILEMSFYPSAVAPAKECSGHAKIIIHPDGTFEIVWFDCLNACKQGCVVCVRDAQGNESYWCECSTGDCIAPPSQQ